MNRLQTIPRFSIDYGTGDFFAALAALFRTSPPSPKGFDSVFGNRPRFWASSGRQALWLILKSLGLSPGAGVAVPLYCDPSVARTVKKAGFTPIFADVEEATLTMNPEALMRVRGQVEAVVVPHFFGHVADMKNLLEVARPLPVIEDTVHAPFSFLDGQMTGSFGAGCFYSFASSKCWPAGGGGLAVINDVDLAGRVALATRELVPAALSDKCWNLGGQAAKALLFHRTLYGLVGRTIRCQLEGRYLLEPVLSTTAIQPGQAAVALRQAARLPARFQQQRHRSLRLRFLLSSVEGIILPVERHGTRYNFHLFPVLLSDFQERDAVVSEMLQRNVDTSQMYSNVAEEAHAVGYRGGCPVSESVARRMLTLPNSAALADRDIEYVAEVFLQALKKHRSRRLSRPEPGWGASPKKQLAGADILPVPVGSLLWRKDPER